MYDYTLANGAAQWIDWGFEIDCSHCSFTCNDTSYLSQAVACPNCGASLDGGNSDA